VPGTVPALSDARALSAGFAHGLALLADGTVWGWGGNYYGQLGDGSTALRRNPVRMGTLTGVQAIAAGSNNISMALLGDGTVRACGENRNGALGIGSGALAVTQPAPVAGLAQVRALSPGGFHALFLVSQGSHAPAIHSGPSATPNPVNLGP
jgi:alpha-tubulin suppressor-like RCC1 family protein